MREEILLNAKYSCYYLVHSLSSDKKGFDLLVPEVRKRVMNQMYPEIEKTGMIFYIIKNRYSIMQTFEQHIKPTIYKSKMLLPTVARLYQLYDEELFGFRYEKVSDKLFSVEAVPED